MVVSFVVAFAVSWFMGIKEEAPAETEAPAENKNEPAVPDNVVLSPLSGKAVALESVPDATFAQGVLGQGAAIEPSEGRVIAPADGTVSTIFDTHHAIGLTLDNGAELLIHIGINTVELNGEGFTAHVSEGDRVTRGQTLITFDKEFIASKGYNTITPVIVSNSDDYAEVNRLADGNISVGGVLLEIAKG